jgi:hypothetical protein
MSLNYPWRNPALLGFSKPSVRIGAHIGRGGPEC